jgi:hypothetical protein
VRQEVATVARGTRSKEAKGTVKAEAAVAMSAAWTMLSFKSMRNGKLGEYRVTYEAKIRMMSLDIHILSCIDYSVHGGDADGGYHGSDSLKSSVHHRVVKANSTRT